MSEPDRTSGLKPGEPSPAALALLVSAALIAFSAALTWNVQQGIAQLRREPTAQELAAIVYADETGAGALRATLERIAKKGPADLAFSTAGSAAALLVEGWYPPEEWGVWSSGPSARMVLPTTVEGKPVRTVRIDFHAFAPPSIAQEFVFSSGDVELARKEVKPQEGTVIPMDFVVLALTADDESGLPLSISISHPVSPQDAGVGPDSRQMGFGLAKVTLNPAG